MRTALKCLFGSLLFACSFLSVFFSSGVRNPYSRPAASGALEAMRFWTEVRAYPYSDIPADKYYTAFQQARKSASNAPEPGPTTSPWQFLGPVNFSGRVISIAIDPTNPTTVYVGSASGGLWVSHSGGLQPDWHRVKTGYPVLGVGAIAINPVSPGTVYIGTGETYSHDGSVGGMVVRTTRGSYGIGILKTTDGGTTWVKTFDRTYNNKCGVQSIRINPLNPNTVFAATSEGLYRSPDAGASWTSVLTVVMAQDVVINPEDTTEVLVSCGNFASTGAGFYRSRDGGVNFAPVSGIPSYSGKALLEVYAAHPNVVYASIADSVDGSGGLWQSTDFGLNWKRISSVTVHGVQGWYSHFVAVHPADSSLVVRAGQISVFKSTNGGVTLSSSRNLWADNHNYAHHPTDPNILYVVDDGGVWRSTNFGSTFQYAGNGLQTSQFYNGSSSSATDSLVAIGSVQDHYAWIYDGTLQWLSSPGGDEVGWTAINPRSALTIYAGWRNGSGLEKSTDGGASFSWNNSGFSPVAAWNTPFVLSPSDTSILYYGGAEIFKSVDGAETWSVTNGGARLDGNPALSMAISATNPDTVYVGTAPYFVPAHLFRTTDGGTAWKNISGTLPNRYPMDLTVDPNDSRIVYAAFGGFGTGHLFKSTDAGTAWIDLTGSLPDVPTTAVIVDPLNPGMIYLGNDLGVYVSTDGGVAWSLFSQGLPEAVIVGDLAISPSNRMLRVFTHSCGVYQRRLLGQGATGVNDRGSLGPLQVVLEQNYPNPFNPSTSISYQLSAAGAVTIKVFDAIGREVTTLVNETKPAGRYTVLWDAGKLASGIYLCRLTTGDFSYVKKMVLVK
jgi:photosystem II stability/assembly factor-like uncharacterized protein